MKLGQLNLRTTLQLQQCARAKKTRSEVLAGERISFDIGEAATDGPDHHDGDSRGVAGGHP